MAEEDDLDFLALPERIRAQIDRAFDDVVQGHSNKGKGKAKEAQRTRAASPAAAGGFIRDDDDEEDMGDVPFSKPTTGGFLPDSPPLSTTGSPPLQSALLPLFRVPDALRLLQLPPRDPEVLEVFENAASGWAGEEDSNLEDDGEKGRGVSRRDWRAVCAVLVEQYRDESDHGEVEMEDDGDDLEGAEEVEDVEEIDGGESDEYIEEEGTADEEGDSGSDYGASQAGPSHRKPAARAGKSSGTRSRKGGVRTRARGRPRQSEDEHSGSSPERERYLTRQQKRQCQAAFQLFFPDVTDESELQSKRIMIKDVSRVASLLKEKLSAEDIVEMLEAFSSSPDKSVGLDDFENMMLQVGLV
ncbi:hypothetical protein BOTBODRAFT_71009 [Botryobasidium botryosum FD-172 SS1]|uniref:EF-hand domain-containing protein n=1 Tax=Botryobasidium botryosum (strain FD-172 SS1) TaxID=930990 RepID=A0A067LVR2_BOTB1|nr:hypothetical protein BOTBODRAFT_71009 [Botryobasidium botryosum FD-172 SS1]